MLFHNSPFPARIIASAAFIAAMLICCSSAVCENLQQTGVVRVETLNMRSAPDTEAPVIRVLEKDTEVRILREDKHWLQVICDGRIGYVYNSSAYLERYTTHRVTKDDADAKRELAMARAREIERRIRQKQQEIKTVSEKQDVVTLDLEKIDRQISRKRSELKDLMAAVEETGARILLLGGSL